MRRRDLIAASSAMLLGRSASAAESTGFPSQLPDGMRAIARYVNIPDKRRLIQLTDRPPNYATPTEVFTSVTTPNDRFFVRYHADGVPQLSSTNAWRLTVTGDAVAQDVTLTWQDILDLPQTDVVAVCQCAGNRRGFSTPHVPGVQWGDGAMGCAIWHGPSLADVLKRAKVKDNALEVWLGGEDTVPVDTIPRFVKSLPLVKAMDPKTLVATSMNNAPLPLLNGNPARLVVPGWTGTYWIKHLNRIEVSSKPLNNFWMKTAYRVPAGMFPVEQPFTSQGTETTVPITEMVVNSLIAEPLEGAEVDRAGFTIRGVAWDRGNGIGRVEVSLDGGKSWQDAFLEHSVGPYAFRRFMLQTTLMKPGTIEIACRATSETGEKQAETLKFNAGGYHNNVPRPIKVTVR